MLDIRVLSLKAEGLLRCWVLGVGLSAFSYSQSVTYT